MHNFYIKLQLIKKGSNLDTMWGGVAAALFHFNIGFWLMRTFPIRQPQNTNDEINQKGNVTPVSSPRKISNKTLKNK